MRIHHIGYLVKDIRAAINECKNFVGGGMIQKTDVFHDTLRLVDISFLEIDGILIELVAPQDGCTDIGEGIKRLGNTPYHICFECGKIEKAISLLTQKGCLLVKEPQPAIAIDNRMVAFLYSRDLGLIEVVEESTKMDDTYIC